MTNRRLIFFKFVVITGMFHYALPDHAIADDTIWKPISADSIINECWDISEDDRNSGSTFIMRSGIGTSVDCLRSQIVIHASLLFHESDYSKEEIEQHLELINKGVGAFYWKLYNENKACTPSCGTMFNTFHLAEVAHYYEDILRDVISQRNELEM